MQAHSGWLLDYQGRTYPIQPQGLRIGRGMGNEIVLTDDQASRRHAIVWNAQGIVYVRDEGSTNGTFVNGKRIAAATPLRAGDRIQIGRTMLSVRQTEGALAPQRVQAVPANETTNTTAVLLGVFAVAIIVLIFAGIAFAVVLAPQSTTVTPVARLVPTQTVALAAPVTVPTATGPSSTDVIGRARMAAVWIVVPEDNSDKAWIGSGSVINARGLILTNYHVVRNVNTNKPYNAKDLIGIFVQSSTDKPPDRAFIAQIAVMDSTLDLAILKLTSTGDGKPLPANLGLTVVPLGDSETVKDDQDIRVIGFQRGSGMSWKDATVTTLKGTVSGFVENHAWIKTDAQIDHGISGGLAINAVGELIGVPTAGAGKIGYIRPINLAKPLIAKAK